MTRPWMLAVTCLSLALLAGCGDKKEAADADNMPAAGPGPVEPGPGENGGPANPTLDPTTVPNGAPVADAGDEAGLRSNFIAPQFVGALLLHPSRAGESSIGKEVLKQERVAESISESGVDPRTMRQVMLLFQLPGPDGPPEPGVVIRFNQAVDGKALLTDALGEDAEEAEHAGKTYSIGPFGNAGMMYDAQTMLMGDEDTLKLMLDHAAPQDTPLVERLGKMNLEQGLAGAFLLEPAREMLGQAAEMANTPGAPPVLAPLAELADKLSSIEIGFDLDNDQMLKVSVEAIDEESAVQVKQVADGLLGMGRLMYPQAKQQMAADPSMENVSAMLDALVNSVAAQQQGTAVQITATRPEGLDAVAAELVTMAMNAATGPPDMWREVEFAEQKFAASFPQEPDLAPLTTPADEDPNLINEWDVFAFSNSSELDYGVRIEQLKPERAKLGAEKLFGEKLEFVDDLRNKKEIQVEGNPGLQYQTVLDFGDTKVVEHHKLVLVGDVLYDLSVSGTEEDTDPTMFFESFRLLSE